MAPTAAGGVGAALEVREKANAEDKYDQIGAGDQGMMIGYACNETPELMPLPIALSHRIARELSVARKTEALPWLLPLLRGVLLGGRCVSRTLSGRGCGGVGAPQRGDEFALAHGGCPGDALVTGHLAQVGQQHARESGAPLAGRLFFDRGVSQLTRPFMDVGTTCVPRGER